MFASPWGVGREVQEKERQRVGDGEKRMERVQMQIIEYKIPLLLTIWIVVLVPNPFYWLSLKITQGDR